MTPRRVALAVRPAAPSPSALNLFLRLLFVLHLGLGLAAASPIAAAATGEPAVAAGTAEAALVLAAGAISDREIVAIGRDVVIEGEARSHVAVLDGSVRVDGRVTGDLIVLGGNARLGPNAFVGGDAYVVGGRLELGPGARVQGRSAAYPTASSAWLALLEGPTLGGRDAELAALAAKLGLLAAWGLVLVGCLAVGAREVRQTAEVVRHDPFRSFFTGLVGVLGLTLLAVFLAALMAWLVGAPLLVLVILVGLAVKLWGMSAVFLAVGDGLAERFTRHRRPADFAWRRRMAPLQAASLGLVVLGVVKLVPWVGTVGWTVASLIGIGATLTTKFGRLEPWWNGSRASVP